MSATPGVLRLPGHGPGPVRAILQRLALALGCLVLVVAVVYLDRHGYRDAVDDSITLLDAVYYATVTLSTTGYGDITPASQQARFVNVLVVTPLRILFLIVLVGTTVEVLTERTRQQYRHARWRATLRDHTVVVGYGTKGRSAVRALVAEGMDAQRIVVVDPDPAMIAQANEDGLAAVLGDATRRDVLEQARVRDADRVLVSAARDDTAVLVVLTVRQLNTTASVVSAVRESENAPLLRQSGATSVVVSSEAAGRLLALSSSSPATGEVLEDLLVPQTGLEVSERPVRPDEIGRDPRESDDLVLAVLRGGRALRFGSAEGNPLVAGDRLVVVHDNRDGE
ncbi:MAG: ion channel rane protein [Frankiales bacterium]|jgi:voltage-gated potassium channel|nr:ion channel rane protein [Frankiales bacterium]